MNGHPSSQLTTQQCITLTHACIYLCLPSFSGLGFWKPTSFSSVQLCFSEGRVQVQKNVRLQRKRLRLAASCLNRRLARSLRRAELLRTPMEFQSMMIMDESDYRGKDGGGGVETLAMLPFRHALSELHDSNIMLSSELFKAKLIDNPILHPSVRNAVEVKPGAVMNPEKHFYPNVLNTKIHPIAKIFFNLGTEALLDRYLRLNPNVSKAAIKEVLEYRPKYFFWAGTDLFHVKTNRGERKMIIVETNSCPSGQKSIPPKTSDRYSGYRDVMEKSFLHITKNADPRLGGLAVIYDKNEMEVSGYAMILSEVAKERVWVVEYKESDLNPPVRWANNLMYVRDAHSNWHSIRAAFRYVTQKPWNRIPLNSRTYVMNNIIACLCGGRNKAMAAHAYNLLNKELAGTGLQIEMPETILNVSKADIPSIIQGMGGSGVIKVPYSNAGQGVYTILNEDDLLEFMRSKQHYEKYLVQSLVEPSAWNHVNTSDTQAANSKFYHIGTLPNRHNKSYVNDIRMMVCWGEKGFQPVSIYSRRARKHIESISGSTSWDMLGTNLSVKNANDNSWDTEADRLIVFDRVDFHKLNLGLNDLVNGYVQTILSVIAIDKLCGRLILPDGEFNYDLFKELIPDKVLLSEIFV